MTDNTQPEAGSTHIIRFALELGLLWIDGDGRDKVREALDALDALEAQLEAIGAGGVQALSAAPGVTSEQRRLIGVIADKIEDGTLFQSGIYPKKDLARFVRNMLDTTPTAPAASPTPPAEQQAAPKAAPGELHDHQILAITTAYEQGVGKGLQAYGSGKEISNPYDTAYRCDLAWQYGYKEGKEQAERIAKAAPQQEEQEPYAYAVYFPDQPTVELVHDLDELTDDLTNREHQITKLYTAPQPAPAPLSDDVVKDAARWRMAALIGNEVMLHPDKRTHATAVKAYMDATHSGSDLTGAVDAAIAAQGGKA